MTIKALSKLAPEYYTPESEKESANPTRFKLRPLTPAEKESVTVYENGQFQIPPRNYGQVLRMGLVDWDNFLDNRDKPVKCTFVNHDRIPSEIRLELAGEILTRSNIDEDEEKNF